MYNRILSQHKNSHDHATFKTAYYQNVMEYRHLHWPSNLEVCVWSVRSLTLNDAILFGLKIVFLLRRTV